MNTRKPRHMIALLVAGVLAFGSLGFAGAQDTADAATTIDLSAAVAGSVVTISAAGTYQASGTLADGQIVVAAPADSAVTLILDGVALGSTTSAPIQITSAAVVTLTLADGTQNTVQFDAAYAEASAAIVSSADLTIAGSGSLTIDAPANDGIAGSASLTLTDTPSLTINAGDDAIRAAANVTIEDGTLNLVAGGGSGATLNDDLSGKGIMADGSILIDGGTLTINAADDAIRAEQDLTMNAGTVTVTADGKAMHGTYNVIINDGVITVLASDEGIEGGFITINAGQIDITASDDGINVSEPDDVAAPSLYYLHISGGTIVVNAEGDGIDSNGSIEMSGGVVIVNGPTGSGDGALDYDGTFNITGGFLVAAGSAGMPAAPGNGSSQASLLIVFDAALPAGTLVSIQSSDGTQLLTFAPAKTFQSLVFSAPELAQGGSYVVYTGGSADGTSSSGLYSGGTYTPGTQAASFTVSDVLTQIGNVRRMR